jgi:hypothetical protein
MGGSYIGAAGLRDRIVNDVAQQLRHGTPIGASQLLDRVPLDCK